MAVFATSALVSAVIIIRRKKMELSGFQGLLAGQAVFRAKDFLQLGGLEKKPQTVSLTKDTHLKTDRRQLSLAPMTPAGKPVRGPPISPPTFHVFLGTLELCSSHMAFISAFSSVRYINGWLFGAWQATTLLRTVALERQHLRVNTGLVIFHVTISGQASRKLLAS